MFEGIVLYTDNQDIEMEDRTRLIHPLLICYVRKALTNTDGFLDTFNIDIPWDMFYESHRIDASKYYAQTYNKPKTIGYMFDYFKFRWYMKRLDKICKHEIIRFWV